MNIKKFGLLFLSTILILNLTLSYAKHKHQISRDPSNPKPVIQLAILLDTSGSMSGLIYQAKTQLWRIVNELSLSKKYNLAPRLEVALYEYGKDSISESEGYIRQIVGLTSDLDKISEELFLLETNGGSEYCGLVISKAVKELAWNNDRDTLKAIFIAGNEPFNQGKLDFRQAIRQALNKSIIINAIHCGSFQEGIDGHWQEGAVLGEGRYININHNQKEVHIPSPQDDELALLSQELNQTYIPYGIKGKDYKNRQEAQDKNAAKMGLGSTIQRSLAKASKIYSNTNWDLVDAYKEGQVKIEDLHEDELNKEMQKMTMNQKKKYLEESSQKRLLIQDKIKKLNEARQKYISKIKKQTQNDTLDSAIIKAIREQATNKGYSW